MITMLNRPHDRIKGYPERERMKQEAYRLWAGSTSTDERMRAVEIVIEAHWHRSREATTRHPDLYTYACHWVSSSLHDQSPLFEPTKYPELYERLHAKYPTPAVLHIPYGLSYWKLCTNRRCRECYTHTMHMPVGRAS